MRQEIDCSFNQNNQEQSLEQINFVKIFHDKLKTIEPLNENLRSYEASYFDKIGVKRVKRKADALYFYTKNTEEPKLNLWIEDPKDIGDKVFIHARCEEGLRDFLNLRDEKLNQEIVSLGGLIIQDEEDRLYFFTRGAIAKELEWQMSQSYLNKRWISLCQEYEIEKIFGQFSHKWTEGNMKRYGLKTKVILSNIDPAGKEAENRYLLSFAKRYGMTNNQYLRFRLLTSPQQGITYDEVADDSIEWDKETRV